MRRRLPPLELIEAFIEAAEAPSFRIAAECCALSPAAFSRRIQAFSGYVGTPVFERQGGGLRLTDAGARCLAELKPAYAEMLRASAAVAQSVTGGQAVTLSLSHSLAVGWLIPRLDRFRAAHPGIALSLRSERGAATMRRGEADLGICFADIDLTGLVSTPLIDVTIAPAASPLIAGAVQRGGRLSAQALLSVAQPADQWAWWARETGHSDPLPAPATYDVLHAMYEVAAEGLGVALVATPTVWPYLDSGRLVLLKDLPHVRLPGGYWLAAPADRKQRRPVVAVWRWLEAEASRTRDTTASRLAA